MGSKRLAWISLVASVIAVVMSIIALVNRCPTQDLYSHFDYMGIIVGILALLVTALIGAQVGQYVFVDKKIEKISGKISRIVSRKVAAEVAHREASKKAKSVAKEAAETKAMEVVGSLPHDISYVLRGKDMMNDASTEAMVGEFMTAIDYTIKALKEFKQCGAEPIYQSTVDDALDTLKNLFEWSKDRGELRILKGQRSAYEDIMKDLRSERLKVCLDYLSQAKELDKIEDSKIREKENKEAFDRILRGEEPIDK